ncbi:MAG: hypothetical protein C0403_12500 [Desulfobacterium sp.]|nr:hypothetical protein [Desulfobacterium sp.]
MAGMLSFTKTIFKILIVISCLFLWSEISSGLEETPTSGKGVITSPSLNVRVGPDRNQGVIQILHKGDEVQILSYQGEWVKISYQKKEGYIRNRERYVRIVHSPELSREAKKDIDVKKKEIEAEKEIEAKRKIEAEKETEAKRKFEAERKLEAERKVHEAKGKSKNIDLEIQKHQAQIQNFSNEETSIINGLDDMELALNRVNVQVRKIRSDLSSLDEKMRKITSDSIKLQQQIRVTEEYIAKRISALYKLNLIGPMHILASADSVYDFIYRKFAMERILEYDDEVLAHHKENKKKLAMGLSDLDNQKKEKVFLESDLSKQIQIMTQKRTRKKDLLKDIQDKKTLELAAIDSLKQAAQALDQTILSLHVEPKKKISRKSASPFNEFKGLLKRPVKGKIISFFGPYQEGKYKVLNYRSGIEIKAERGEPIQAVHSGIVLYSGWFKSYGNMMIIDHGEHYYTLYAHAEELFKSKGDYVEAEEVIATVGDTASMTGSNLYFEVRHRGEPMNPLNWLGDS